MIQATRESMDHVELASVCLFLLLSEGQMCLRPLKASEWPARIHRPVESFPFYFWRRDSIPVHWGTSKLKENITKMNFMKQDRWFNLEF